MKMVLITLILFLMLCLVIGGAIEYEELFSYYRKTSVATKYLKDDKAVTIFGRSDILDTSIEYKNALHLGSKFALEGFTVISGGYHGTMEAVSKGARINEGATVGIIIPSLFPNRPKDGNPYLTTVVRAASMSERVDKLTNLTKYFVILPGAVGTLHELFTVWNKVHLESLEKPDNLPLIVLLADPWKEAITTLASTIHLPASQMKLLKFVDSVDEAVDE